MDENLDRTLAELLKDLKPRHELNFSSPSNSEAFPFRKSPFEVSKPIDPALANLFGDRIMEISGEPMLPGFRAMPGFLYHGTSLAALDMILESGMMYPATYLLRERKLVSGELKDIMDREKDERHNGPKFMSREAMIKMGMLTADDPHLYEFGHAGDVVFGSHPLAASGYLPKDHEQAAIIGVDSKVLAFYGAKLIDAKGEGILHEGPVSIRLALRQLLVPDARVEEYDQRARESYLVTVFPLSVLKN